jgi:hypothetical protein
MDWLGLGLKVAFDATGLVPGLAEVHGALRIAQDVEPAVVEAIEYFRSEEGQRAIAHLRKVSDALIAAMPKAEFATPGVQEERTPGWHLEWDLFQGNVWVEDEK